MSSSQSGFYQEPSGVSGLYQDVWGRVTGSEIVSLHISNMPNKMLWHTKHIAYIPMVQKLSVCTCQTCQIKLMEVGHCFVWCYGYSIYTWGSGPLLRMACMSQPWFLFQF